MVKDTLRLDEPPEETNPPAKEPGSESNSARMITGKPHGFKHFLTRKSTIICGLLILLVGAAAAIWFTDLRYPVFNLFAKGRVEVVVADAKTLQPLKGATITIDGQTAKTNDKGEAAVGKIKLGKQEIKVSQTAYKTVTRHEKIFTGTTKLQPVQLEGMGVPLSFRITDRVSGLPLKEAEVKIDNASTKTNDKGEAILTIAPRAGVKPVAKITHGGYLEANLEVEAAFKKDPYTQTLLPSTKVYFLSKRDGKIGIYQSYLDGTEQKILLPGTGKESEDTKLFASANNKWLALISNREGKKGPTGSPLPILYVINTETKTVTAAASSPIENSPQWYNDSLIYAARSLGTQTGMYLGRYDALTKKETKLVSSERTYLGSATLYDNTIYYAREDTTSNPERGLWRIQIDGSNHKHIHTNVYSILAHITKEKLLVYWDTGNNSPIWQHYNIATGKFAPTNVLNKGGFKRTLLFSPNNQHALAAQTVTASPYVPGTTTLFLTDGKGEGDKQIAELGTVTLYFSWLTDDYIAYTVRKPGETAVYVKNIQGGATKKMSDVHIGPTQ